MDVSSTVPKRMHPRAGVAAVVIAAVALLAPSGSAAQDPEPSWLPIWGPNDGILADAKTWSFRQSCVDDNDQDAVLCEGLLGSAGAADPNLDDSNWRTFTFDPENQEFNTGPNVANHYRKRFTLAEVGVNPFVIEGMRFGIQEDDTAVAYLNGWEVYRSTRGNLDPEYQTFPEGTPGCFSDPAPNCDIPHDVPIPFGGAEEFLQLLDPYEDWQRVLDADGDGVIEANEEQVWAVTVWNRQGSTDTTFNHTFDLLLADAPPPRVQINEVLTANDSITSVDLDGDGMRDDPLDLDDDGDLDSPDLIELYNFSASPVNLSGWRIADSSAVFDFPAVTISAGGYLVIAANDCAAPGGGPCTVTAPPQANFKLSKLGDSLTLTNSDGFVEDQITAIPDQFTDGSWGRVNDGSSNGYLLEPTFGTANTAAGDDYVPVLRAFPNRLYNVGETIDLTADAFDPDNDPLAWGHGVLGDITIDETGRLTGTASPAGTHVRILAVSDSEGAASQPVSWTFIPPPTDGPRLVLNEYNAVPNDGELLGGDGTLGNGGDWFEFLVIEDRLDLRGWTIELWDRKGTADQLRNAASLTFNDNPALRSIPAGTLIVIGEEVENDFSFDAMTDWTIEFRVTNTANGAFFEPPRAGEIFNSTRADNMVLIRDSNGDIAGPVTGETDAWDTANGGVNDQEVMNLCANPTLDAHVDPVGDYRDNGLVSTRGLPNQCRYTEVEDPADPNSPVLDVVFNQDLSALRSAASGNGDIDGDAVTNNVDAQAILDAGAGAPPDAYNERNGDVNADGVTDLLDALIIAQRTANPQA